MRRLTATEVAREFSAVINRVGAGEEIEVIRNGVPVAEMRAPASSHTVPAARWDELMASAPLPDEDFARDVESSRGEVGPPSGAWPS